MQRTNLIALLWIVSLNLSGSNYVFVRKTNVWPCRPVCECTHVCKYMHIT